MSVIRVSYNVLMHRYYIYRIHDFPLTVMLSRLLTLVFTSNIIVLNIQTNIEGKLIVILSIVKSRQNAFSFMRFLNTS